MSKSNCEELIGILWIILSLMLFDRGFVVCGWITFGLGLFGQLCAMWYAGKATINKTKEKEGK